MKKSIVKVINKIDQDLPGFTSNSNDMSLFNGLAGVALFYYQLYSFTKEEKYVERIYDILDRIIESINDADRIGSSLCNGLAGIAFVFNFLIEKKVVGNELRKPLLQLDDILLESVKLYTIPKNYDFLHGGLGIIFYLLERCNTNKKIVGKSKELFNEHLDYVQAALEGSTKMRFLDREGRFTNVINFGMAHGYIASISLMSQYSRFISIPQAMHISESFSKLLFSYRSTGEKSRSIYPSIVTSAVADTYNTPLGWCYGDNIIALSLFSLAGLVNDNNLRMEAEQLALETLKREEEKNLVKDAIICHGTAGVAYIYKQLYRTTSNSLFEKAYYSWLKMTVKMAEFEDGVGGYKKFQKSGVYLPDYSILGGGAGIGLILMDSLNIGLDEDWNKIFLLQGKTTA